MKPELRREGDRFVYEFGAVANPVRIAIDHLRDDSEGLRGEIRIETLDSDEEGHRGLFHWATLNLSSTIARTTLTKLLSGRNASNQWALMLEQVCAKTAELWRQPPPLFDLLTVGPAKPVTYTIRQYIPVGEVTILAGDGDSGKSWLAMAMCIAVASGRSIGPFTPDRSGPVLYLDYETSVQEARRRQAMVCAGFGISPVHPIHYRELARPLIDEMGTIRADVSRTQAVFCVLDSLAPATADEHNQGTAAIAVMRALRSLPLTPLALAHVSKASADQNGGRARTYGSVFYENLARSVWEVRKDESELDPVVGLYHRKSNLGRKYEPRAVQLMFDDERGIVTVRSARLTASPQLSQFASLRIRLNGALRDGALNTRELAETVGADERVVRAELRRMPNVVQLEEKRAGRHGSPAVWGLAAHEDSNDR